MKKSVVEGRESMISTSTISSGDIDCPDGGTELAIGVDYDDSGSLDSWEISTYEKICNGEGRESMGGSTISTGDIDCPDGGTELAIGIDYDDSGSLDSWEISTYEKICNGLSGTDGQHGNDGADGIDGHDSLISSSSEPADQTALMEDTKWKLGLIQIRTVRWKPTKYPTLCIFVMVKTGCRICSMGGHYWYPVRHCRWG